MSSNDHQFAFVCGLHRSGTSLLHRCIRSHPAVSGFEDTGAPKNEGQHLQSVYPPGCEFGPVNRFGFDSGAHLDETSRLATQENARELRSEWAQYWNLEKPVLVEKSPPNLLRTRFLQALFPNAYFIVILRHPVAVSFATIKWNAERIDHLLRHWLVCHETFKSDQSHLQNVLILKYEALVSQPVEVLKKVFSFIGVEPIAPHQAIRKDLNEKYFDMWRERPIGHYNIAPVRKLARTYCQFRFGRRVKRFGYSLRDLSRY